MRIYKILTAEQWAALEQDGETAGGPADLADGFVHFSTAEQVAATAAKHFAGQDGLWLLALDPQALGPALRWEPARGGQLFPHLYGRLRRSNVLWAEPMPLGPDGTHRLPAAL